MKKKLYLSVFCFATMLGFTSVSALSNKDFGYADGQMHQFRSSTAYDSFDFRDIMYGNQNSYDASTGTSNRYKGSFSQNQCQSYSFTPVTKGVGVEAVAKNNMSHNLFKSHHHYGRAN